MLGVLSGASLAQINTGPVDVLKPVLRPGIATLDILPIRPRTFTAICPEGAYVADVVAIDHPMVFNRIGAQNINWMMYALRHDVTDDKGQYPLDHSARGEELFQAARSRH